MKVTPLDIRQQQFPLRFRGFDRAEVYTFLELVAGEVEEVSKENARLKEALATKDQDIQRMREGEEDLRKALLAVHRIKEEWIERAEKQAEQVLTEVELKGKQILMDAERKLEFTQAEIQGLKRQRRQLVLQIRILLEQHLKLLEAEVEEGEAEGNL